MVRRRVTRKLRNERAAVLVEFSLVFVLFIALLYGLIAFGLVLALKQSVTNAAAEGARAAVGQYTATDAGQTAYAQARDGVDWVGGSRCCWSDEGYAGADDDPDAPLVINPVTQPCDEAEPEGPACSITVTVRYDYDRAPLVPALELPGFSFLFPDTISSEATVGLPAPPPPAP